MKSLVRLFLFACLLPANAAVTVRSAFAQNIVEQRIVLNWGTWNWDYYAIHGILHLGSGLPDGHYQLRVSERNDTHLFDTPFQIVNGQATPAEWSWGDFSYQARFVPNDGWRTTAIYAKALDGPAQGTFFPATGQNTVWRQDSFYVDGNVPEAQQKNFDLHINVGGFPPVTPTPGPYSKCDDDKSGGNQESCQSCNNVGMARYSVHSMLVSLNIQDTPLRYSPPRGPAVEFNLTYNQKETEQPVVFSYSNLGPKWTFGWLSYVTDNPTTQLSSVAVYLPGGGTENYSFNSVSQTFAPESQSHALLVRTSPNSYEKRFPDGSKQIFNLSSGATTYPRKIFMTQMVDPAGNGVVIGYDSNHRITTVTDALGRVTILSYKIPTEPLRITKVTDPFGRTAAFQYESGRLKTITDAIGIQSRFTYQTGTDSIDSLTTPYGTTTFVSGENGTSRWIEITDPLGGKERVEYRDQAPGISATEPVAPNVPGIVNAGLDWANTFYWDKKAMADAPGDYTKARIKHWLYHSNGSVSGVLSSEKRPLENRVWYTYVGQPDYQHIGASANPSQVARVLSDGTTQLFQYEHNNLGKTTRVTDPAGRVTSFTYDSNQIDLLEVRQTTGETSELLRRFTYNSSHQPLNNTDAAGQVTAVTYDGFGQVLARKNAKNETTSYAYGGSAPAGFLASITSPPVNGISAVTSFGYDSFNRVRTITGQADQYTVTTDYDNLNRKIKVTYPDLTYEQFEYTDNITGTMTLDLTRSRDRMGRWTYRHYDANRHMDAMTEPGDRTTRYGWCVCGSLISITDPNGNLTLFRRDLQGRVYQKVFADETPINYLFEGQTAPGSPGATGRLQSSTDALQRRTNYTYLVDNNISRIDYTDTSGNPLTPPTASVSFTYDPHYDRLTSMSDGTGLTSYSYYAITNIPTPGAGRLQSVDGPLANDTITFGYDQLGRTISQAIPGTIETADYDALGRLTTTENGLGHFQRKYHESTFRLRMITYPNGQKTVQSYFGNDHDRSLQTLQNLNTTGGTLSKFDYARDAAGQIISMTRSLETTSSGMWFDYDDARELTSARNASNPGLASQRYDYAYDDAGNRVSDSNYDPHPVPIGGWLNGTFTTYTSNELNQLDTRAVQVNNIGPSPVSLVYDLAGNLVDDGDQMRFEWDAANRLVAIDYRNDRRSEFLYDGLSRRVQVVEKSGSIITSTRRFVWFGSRIAQERDENNSVRRDYFAEGELQRGLRGANTEFYYTRDHLGSVREITNRAGAIQARYEYDPYGKRNRVDGKFDTDFGYTGHYHHAPSGLILAPYRAYDPVLGRWLSRDPIEEKGGLNLYGYVENDPLNATDALGLIKIYGNWCGPDWTGGRKEAYTVHPPGYYRIPINKLDSACETHDICYNECRTSNPCESDLRGQCFRECDRALTGAAYAFGGFWGRVIGLAIDRPGKREPGPDESICCQNGK